MKNNCIEFQGCKNRGGYGQKWRNGKMWLAHRLAYMDAHGPILKGQVVRHMCHNPSCVNPDHLVLGTQADNIQDMVDAGRQTSKLTEAQAREIHNQKPPGRSPHGFSQALANKYGVTKHTIYNIWHKRTWPHIHPE